MLSLRRQLWALRIRGSGEEYKFGFNKNYKKEQCNVAESSGHTEHRLLPVVLNPVVLNPTAYLKHFTWEP